MIYVAHSATIGTAVDAAASNYLLPIVDVVVVLFVGCRRLLNLAF